MTKKIKALLQLVVAGGVVIAWKRQSRRLRADHMKLAQDMKEWGDRKAARLKKEQAAQKQPA